MGRLEQGKINKIFMTFPHQDRLSPEKVTGQQSTGRWAHNFSSSEKSLPSLVSIRSGHRNSANPTGDPDPFSPLVWT